MNVKFNKLNSLVFSAFCCALTCVCAKVSFPIGPVPITFATLAVYFSGALLGAKFGSLSQILYLILLFVGLPVGAGLKSGFSVFVGPTGGYLIGYVFMAAVVGFLYKSFKGNRSNENLTDLNCFVLLFVSCVIGTLFCYGLGLFQYIIVTGTNFMAAFSVCVVPFLIGDFLKVCVVSYIVPKIEKIFKIG